MAQLYPYLNSQNLSKSTEFSSVKALDEMYFATVIFRTFLQAKLKLKTTVWHKFEDEKGVQWLRLSKVSHAKDFCSCWALLDFSKP